MSASSRPRRSFVVAGVAVMCVLIAWWVWPSSGDDQDGATAGASSDRSGGRSGESGIGGGGWVEWSTVRVTSGDDSKRDETDGLADARGEVSRFLRASSRALKSADGDRMTPAATATGSALDATRAAAAEFEDNGWHQVGTARILSASILADQRSGSPPRMTVRACVDSSDVDVVDESGQSVRTGSYAARSAMLFDLVRRDGNWLVEHQGFPDDPDC